MTTSPPEPQANIQEPTQQIIDAVHKRFAVANEFLREEGVIEFNLDPVQIDTKSRFLSILDELRSLGRTTILRRTDQGYLLLVFRKPAHGKPNLKLPLILFFATLAAVFVDGIVRPIFYSSPASSPLTLSNEVTFALIYTVALMGILGIHELGHKIASWQHKMDSSWPFFIPGIPGVWPTFGAVIRAADPPPNRDSLFDLGLSGPIAGLLVTVIVSIIAMFTAQTVSASSIPASLLSSGDYYTSFLINLFLPSASGQVVTGALFNLLYFAYSIGFLITFINLLPAWQLDGGHIANSALSPKVHRILTYVSAGIMLLSGFYLMAILVLLFSGRAPALQPLDDVSPLSSKRKVFFVLTWILAGAIGALVIYNNPYFGIGLLFR